MGRLIDEDILIKRIYEYQTNAIDTEDVIHSIKTMPTAYDVEAVVAELEKFLVDGFDCSDCPYDYLKSCKSSCEAGAFAKAIEIVRGKE